MSDQIALVAQPAEVRFSIEIKRAETGQVEMFDLIGRIETQPEETKETPECQ